MRCRSWRILLVVALAVVVAPAVHAQFRDVIPEGFLPLSTIDLKSYYARVVTETLSPDGAGSVDVHGGRGLLQEGRSSG